MKKMICWLILVMLAAPLTVIYAQESTPEADPVVTTRSALPDSAQFRLVEVVSGLRNPLYVTQAGDGSERLFVVEQSGRIWIVSNGALLDTPFLDLSNIVSQDVLSGYSERGLLGLVFHPDYAENGRFFVNYTDTSGNTHVVEYAVSSNNPDAADPNSARELLSLAQPYRNHNGGHMAFGPDGYLYIAAGDGGAADDPPNNGQNPATLLGTILRIDVDDFDATQPYGIPEDNPFSRDPSFAPEVWAWGLRNPWRFSFDRATGDLYIADVGQNQWEEINFQPADSSGGENYGWVAYEGTHRYLGPEPQGEVVMPIAEYSHSDGCSVTGGYVYRGEAISELQAAYIYGDWCSGRIWAAYRDDSGAWHSGQIMNVQMQISSFGEDEAGELYIVDYGGRVLRFEPVESGGS